MVHDDCFNPGGDFVLIKLTIPGEPCAKGRPRVGKFGTYTPEKTLNYETLVKELYIIQHANKKLQGQLKIDIKAYFKIPQGEIPKAKKPKPQTLQRYNDILNGKIRHTKKPDWDNVGKIISDALNGLAYDDDSQIVSAIVEKFYSNDPRVEVEISEVAV
ncbi:endodeoxyribonuclease RusA [Ruminiclostridium papyrosolvens DSM 2782]|uniref:Endodeoxyribonuclease RusA n=1 Tax=Ruminiclostridium papyrosolvens DSM 2782 TaxID=588581 RepID=F1TEC8_9FIRM|nr:endodeoxyribonuclease RusA [Ruminiclostridium papyrosolvens DSM 2782]